MKYLYLGVLLPAIFLFCGCGTTKFSDTTRTATEQILISSAMEDAVDEFNFYPLSGRKIYIVSDGVSATDKNYLLTILRQQLAANGVLLQDEKEKADYVLEVATGAVGTDRCELIYGTKETTVPSLLTLGTSTTIPEFALAKRTDQKAKVKLTMWAYNRTTGAIVWQSGQKDTTASIRDRWVLGVGPITQSSFNEQTQIVGDDVPFSSHFGERVAKGEKPSVRTEATYRELDQEAIDRLASIRKAGFEMMSRSPEETAADSESTEPKSDSSEETQTEETSENAETPADSPAENTAEIPAAEESAPDQAEKPAETLPPAPKKLTVLEFDDDFTLSPGQTFTP